MNFKLSYNLRIIQVKNIKFYNNNNNNNKNNTNNNNNKMLIIKIHIHHMITVQKTIITTIPKGLIFLVINCYNLIYQNKKTSKSNNLPQKICPVSVNKLIMILKIAKNAKKILIALNNNVVNISKS